MKRTELIKRLRRQAKERGVTFQQVREGSRHTVFRCGTKMTTVPRHREIAEGTARAILRLAEQGFAEEAGE